eukprot:gnl/MRDRNA2_/MRDRNA2_31871_c0_seq1.p1 gnl/MRDRNA2_/MRDRNA2_31871_c0~~gnl/MRDRNA2_/MRDRNA2_31871_c0_seq1.p1  ORF type:complete len:844 (+),score=121.51 gnl/MRDRNA2_/MRDRNA2_31871_c0_seq1:124-2655(+)
MVDREPSTDEEKGNISSPKHLNVPASPKHLKVPERAGDGGSISHSSSPVAFGQESSTYMKASAGRKTTRSNARLEPTDLNLEELAMKKHGIGFQQLKIEDQVNLIREGLTPKKFLINPNSLRMQKWGIVVLIALIYTALVTPFEVAYLTSELNALFVVNRFVDVVFLIDMCMQFFLKVEVNSRQGSTWIRDRKVLAMRYMKCWFWIDLVSILPFDILGIVDDSPTFAALKSVRIIRLLRLLKLVRIVKASRMLSQWQNYVAMKYSSIALLKLSVGLVCMAHWLACVWGLQGKMYSVGTQIECDTETQTVKEWHTDMGTEGVSWITALYHPDEGKTSPDNPCNPNHLYAASLHWSIMTITSIGYGDIVPVRFEEYLIECLCMLMGAITWAFIIGSACGVLSNLDPYKVQFESTMDSLNYMLEDQEFPYELRYRLREYFAQSQHMQRLQQYQKLKGQMSNTLKGEVALHTTQRWLRRVWYFSNCRRVFIIEVAQSLKPWLYATREVFPIGEVMYIVERGLCARGGNVLCVGHCWGEDMILESDTLRDRTPCVALTYCEVWSLTKVQLQAICARFPREKKRIRKATVTLAVIRGMIRLAEQVRIQKRIKQRKPKYDLADVALGGLVSKTRDLEQGVSGGWPATKDEADQGPPPPPAIEDVIGTDEGGCGGNYPAAELQNISERLRSLETYVAQLGRLVQAAAVENAHSESAPEPSPAAQPEVRRADASEGSLPPALIDDIADAVVRRLNSQASNVDSENTLMAWGRASMTHSGTTSFDGSKRPLKSLPHPWSLGLRRSFSRRKSQTRVAASDHGTTSKVGESDANVDGSNPTGSSSPTGDVHVVEM